MVTNSAGEETNKTTSYHHGEKLHMDTGLPWTGNEEGGESANGWKASYLRSHRFQLFTPFHWLTAPSHPGKSPEYYFRKRVKHRASALGDTVRLVWWQQGLEVPRKVHAEPWMQTQPPPQSPFSGAARLTTRLTTPSRRLAGFSRAVKQSKGHRHRDFPINGQPRSPYGEISSVSSIHLLRVSQQLFSPQAMKDCLQSICEEPPPKRTEIKTNRRQLGGNRGYRAWRKLKQI